MRLKYVMFAGDNFVIIPNSMKHSDVSHIGRPVSAGFCIIQIVENSYGEPRYNVKCWGKSESLNLESREDDSMIMSIGLNVS